MGVSANPREGRKLTYYKEHLENPLIDETVRYYRVESEDFLQSHTVSEYIIRVCNANSLNSFWLSTKWLG